MASRAPSTLLSHTTSAPVNSSLFQPTSARASPRPVSATPRLDALADVGSALSPTYLKPGMPPQYQPIPLTGAAALEDLRRQKEMEQDKQQHYMTSPNPAAHTRAVLSGQSMQHMMSSSALSPHPPSPHPPMSDKSPQPPRILGSNVPPPQTSSRMEPPQITSSPLAMSSPLRPPLSTTPSTMTPIPENPRKRPASPKVERSNKAKSYPPPPPNLGEHRNMSFPAPDTPGRISRSPSTTKKHKCPHCETEFTRHHNLKSHLLTHSQEKPYACVQCPSKFRRLHDLKRHQKLHSGERPHVCDRCGRKFARGDALARHNKGPGGCAGVRGQGEGDDEDEDGQDGQDDTTMMDADDRDEEDLTHSGSRRQSEPHRDSIVSSPSAYRQYSSTYPPPLTRMSSTATTSQSQMRPMYPPPTTSSSVSTSRDNSYARSPTEITHPQSYGYSFGGTHPSAPSALSSLPPAASGPGSAAFGPPSGGVMMTESPQPLTRDQADEVHRSGGTSYSSLSAKMHETQLQPRLPPPGPNANTLPSLPSLQEARYAGPGHNTNPNPPPMQPPAILTNHPPLSTAAQQNSGYGAPAGTQPSITTSGPTPTSAISSTASASTSAPYSLNSAGPQTQPSSASSLREMYPSALAAIPSQPASHPHPHAQPHPHPTTHGGHETRSSAGSLRELGLSNPSNPSNPNISNPNGSNTNTALTAANSGPGSTGDSAAVEYIRAIERREQVAQAELVRLQHEVEFLKAQLAQSQQQVAQCHAQIGRLQQVVGMGGMGGMGGEGMGMGMVRR